MVLFLYLFYKYIIQLKLLVILKLKTILIHSDLSTGEKTSSSELYFVQSAVFYRIFGKMYLFWVALKLFFDLKQSKIKITQVYNLFSQALKGKKAYVNHTKL